MAVKFGNTRSSLLSSCFLGLVCFENCLRHCWSFLRSISTQAKKEERNKNNVISLSRGGRRGEGRRGERPGEGVTMRPSQPGLFKGASSGLKDEGRFRAQPPADGRSPSPRPEPRPPVESGSRSRSRSRPTRAPFFPLRSALSSAPRIGVAAGYEGWAPFSASPRHHGFRDLAGVSRWRRPTKQVGLRVACASLAREAPERLPRGSLGRAAQRRAGGREPETRRDPRPRLLSRP